MFDLEDMENEESVEVRETEDSFRVGDAATEQQSDPLETGTKDSQQGTAELPRNDAEEKAKQLKSNLAEAEIESENGIDAPALHELLESKRETLFKPQMTITRNEI